MDKPATRRQLSKLFELFTEKNVTAKRMQLLLASGLLADLLDASDHALTNDRRGAFRDFLYLCKMPVITDLPGVEIPVKKVSFSKRVRDGQYGNFEREIYNQGRFRLTLPAGPRNLVLAHFNQKMCSYQVIQWCHSHDYAPALIDDLAAVGSHPEYMNLQSQFEIAQVGSVYEENGGLILVYLSTSKSFGRIMFRRPDSDDVGFEPATRFLLVKK